MKLYLDTSIPNFLFAEDAPDKRESTRQLFAHIQQGTHQAFLSGLYVRELRRVSDPLLRYQLSGVPKIYGIPFLPLSSEAQELAQHYVDAQAFTEKNYLDAFHVAIATVGDCEAIVSWNFQHIVRAWTMRKVAEVNARLGRNPTVICTPQEVI